MLVDEAAQASELSTLQAFAFGCKQCAQCCALPMTACAACLYALLCLHLRGLVFTAPSQAHIKDNMHTKNSSTHISLLQGCARG